MQLAGGVSIDSSFKVQIKTSEVLHLKKQHKNDLVKRNMVKIINVVLSQLSHVVVLELLHT